MMALVDVHAHFVPPGYREALRRGGVDRPDGFPYVPDWSPASALALMDELGIEAQLLSISSPGLGFVTGADRLVLAREVNEEGAEIVREYPDRFGLLASLPLPDVDAALDEIDHAGRLGADGFVVLSNYDGIYLGDARFEPVMDELDRRGAVVLLHPTSPPGADAVALGLPRPLMEFIFDTTRAVVNLVLSGTLDRHPQLKVIVPHVGSALPSLTDRVSGFAALALAGDLSGDVDVDAALGRLYYDLAGAPFPHGLPGLLGIARADHLLYSSDTPFTPAPAIARATRAIATTDLLDTEQKDGLFAGTARRLFPRLA
jgi:predicted TIM-barrel fold metal-dependent hydrolase